jgi:CDP-diacylglycerol--glycerol-3-phosphate 3-phosphatidyltransferase
MQLAQVPNGLTVLRLALIPVFIVIVATAEGGQSWAAALVFTGAGLTDQLDGRLARRWRVESTFGRIADPLADRLMIDAAVIALWLHGRLPWLALAVILVRDVVHVGGYKLVEPRG